MSAQADFDRLGELLSEVPGLLVQGRPENAVRCAREHEDEAGNIVRRLAFMWPEVVGEEVAANAQPVQLREGRLVVSTSSSAWAQSLQFMGEAIVDRLNACLGEEAVVRVVFRHAGWEQSSAHPRSEEVVRGSKQGQRNKGRPFSIEEEAVLGEVKALTLESRLEEAIVRAVRASFGRK